MPARGSSLAGRRVFWIWLSSAALSGLLIATPPSFRERIASALEWSVFLPVRAVLGWDSRSLASYQENRRLSQEAARSLVDIARLRDAGRENRSLRRLLGMQARSTVGLTAGRVVGRSADWASEVLWIELSAPGRPGAAVISADGLVGRLRGSAGGRAQVETLRHSAMVVSILDGRSGEQAIARYEPSRPGLLVSEPVPLQADFRVGDPIHTSGLGEVFPAGILVGHVRATVVEPRSQMKAVLIRPASRRGRVQEVFILDERPPIGDASSLFVPPEPTPARPVPLPGEGGILP